VPGWQFQTPPADLSDSLCRVQRALVGYRVAGAGSTKLRVEGNASGRALSRWLPRYCCSCLSYGPDFVSCARVFLSYLPLQHRAEAARWRSGIGRAGSGARPARASPFPSSRRHPSFSEPQWSRARRVRMPPRERDHRPKFLVSNSRAPWRSAALSPFLVRFCQSMSLSLTHEGRVSREPRSGVARRNRAAPVRVASPQPSLTRAPSHGPGPPSTPARRRPSPSSSKSRPATRPR
jgi:hypothetical protein